MLKQNTISDFCRNPVRRQVLFLLPTPTAGSSCEVIVTKLGLPHVLFPGHVRYFDTRFRPDGIFYLLFLQALAYFIGTKYKQKSFLLPFN